MRKIVKMAVFVKISGHCGQKKWPLKMLKMGVFSLFLGVLRNVEDEVAVFIV